MKRPKCIKCGDLAAFPEAVTEPFTCLTCQEPEQPESSTTAEAKGGSLKQPGWTADQQLKILCETLRNITNGTTHLHEGNYDHAALDLECAAGKLRLLERCRQSNTEVRHGGPDDSK